MRRRPGHHEDEKTPTQGEEDIENPQPLAGAAGAAGASKMKVPGQSRRQRKRAGPRRSPKKRKRQIVMGICRILIILSVFVGVYFFLHREPSPNNYKSLFTGGARSFLTSTGTYLSAFTKSHVNKQLAISSWNIAAINNNPFEYWITYKENPDYEKLMVKVESFIENPGDQDVPVSSVFTEGMFDQLDHRLTTTAGWKSVKKYWDDDFKNRRIIENFMKDPLLGSKRLASMPDRVTNTIYVEGKTEPVLRPTVINMYGGDLSTMGKWWKNWEKFMFDTSVKIKNKEGIVEDQKIYELLKPISKSKYPDITEQEAADSLPLQTLCGAIFDAILVHMMNTVSDPKIWQPLKSTMVEALNKKKVPNTMHILENTYHEADIITLQEVATSFIDQAKKGKLGKNFHIYAPNNMDTTRDQNSVILLNKETFPMGSTGEITDLVQKAFPEDKSVPVAIGDVLALKTVSRNNHPYIVASFHGDTNGLATKPVLDALVKAINTDDNGLKDRDGNPPTLIFGLDANTYEKAKPGKQQDVLDFAELYNELSLTSCWGDTPNPQNYTTFNARTFLQPQLNKACKQNEKREKGDINPKDFILFYKTDFKVIQTIKDNTGKREYIENMAFPTLNFPSDHGILSTILEVKDDEKTI